MSWKYSESRCGSPGVLDRQKDRKTGSPGVLYGLRVTGSPDTGYGRSRTREFSDVWTRGLLGILRETGCRDMEVLCTGVFRGCVKACVRIVDMHCVGIRGGRGRSRVGGWCRGRLLCVGGLSDIRVGCEPKKIRKPGFVTSTPFPPNPPSPEPPSSPFPYDFRRDRFQPLPLLFPGIP